MLPSAPSCRFTCGDGGVVVVELESSLPGDAPEDPHVCVGHDRPAPGSGIGIETSTASGSACGASSSRNRPYPTASVSLSRNCGASPHTGQAVRNADAVGVKRIRQLGQQAWVMSDPFGREQLAFVRRDRQSRSALARQFASATWAGTVHHRIVQCGVTGLEIHPVATSAEHPQDIAAFTAILTTSIDDACERARFGRRNQRPAGHWVTASPLMLPPTSSQRSASESSRATAALRRAMSSIGPSGAACSSNRPAPAPSRTTRAACAASSRVAYGLECARLSPSLPRIVQQYSPPLSSNTRNVIAGDSDRLAARRATCRLARDFCVAVATADRLSALLAKKHRPGSEKSRAL